MVDKVVFITSGSSWTVPSDFTAVNTIEVIGGGGGAGCGQAGVSYGAAGGGAAYSKISNLTLTPGASITVQIGAGGTAGATQGATGTDGGDTWFNGASLGASSVGAKGGKHPTLGIPSTGGLGGASASGVGTTKNSGGDGGPASVIGSGGAGGAAGPNGAGGIGGNSTFNGGSWSGGGGGGNGGGSNGGTGASGGPGGDGGNNSGGTGHGVGGNDADGTAGTNGGGGGGGENNFFNGGAGGAGIEWTSTAGPTGGSGGGGGAGGGDATTSAGTGGAGALYGGGGGGSQGTTPGNAGAQGIIVVTYTPGTGTTVNLTGVSGTGAPGAFTVTANGNASVNMVGVAGTGAPGAFAANSSPNVTLTGVSGIGATGTFNPQSASVIILAIAPYLPGDTIGTKTFQVYQILAGVLTAVGSGVTIGFTAIPNITNGWWVEIQVAPNGSFGDFAGIAVFGNINGSDARAIELYSPPTSVPSTLVIDKVAPFQVGDVIVTPGYQLYDKTGAASGSHVTAGILAIPGITNGYATKISLTPDVNNGAQFGILWDGG